MKQTTKRFLSMIMGMVFLVGSMVIYFQFIIPVYNETLQLKGKKISLQTFLEKEKQAVDKVKQLIATYKNSNNKIQQTVSLVLPTEPDVPGAIAQLYGLSQNNNFQFKGVSFSVAGLSNVAMSGGLRPGNLQAALQRPVGTVSLSTTLTGSYEDFKSFLSQLSSNIRIFDLKSLVVSPIFKVNTKDKTQSIEAYSFGLTLSTYYQSP